ncbi:DeoR/GlpR family DNA-binding transcription regulator [Petroclostridium sp. X23]|uniref:DeoR/GlpR family DNA-binding transcription regulator n=1 Tax=Petroclostridium sp. X23 TaxID=3045146 RepID=UPI0024ACAA2E|nr:DeoR/GlpR family DNA-binding transcription regulator [Petroclostridium sp. X23]WHH58116.1 DeoR/GlpR family DNA-binding transcription regulator [Petroclostridium sp. X23]
MLHDRRNKIIQMISNERMVKVSDLIEIFNVSIETIRRDLEYLEKKGYLKRVYGGAVSKSMYGLEPEYSSREVRHYNEKYAIALKALELIDDGDIIEVDIGTTTLEFAKLLKGKKKVTVITNSMQIAMVLADDKDINVILLGGNVRGGEFSTSGFLSENSMDLFNVDKVILGIGGITIEGGITDYHIEETNLRRHAIGRTNKVIALGDHSKFGVTAMNKVCSLQKIDTIVTDNQTDKQMIAKLRSFGIKIFVADVVGE